MKFLEKEADLSDIWEASKPYVKPAAIVGGLIGIPILIDQIAGVGHQALTDSMKNMLKKDKFKADFSSLINDAKKIGNISNTPHIVIEGYNNAAYIPPKSIPDHTKNQWKKQANQLLKSKDKDLVNKGKFIQRSLEFSNKPNGGIIIGDKFDNPAVVSHEIGHAIINANGGFDKLVQDYSATLKNVGVPISLVGLATKMLKPDLGDYIFFGGLGTFGLGALGKLYTEWNASSHAKNILKEMDMDSETKNDLLNYALGTYAIKDVAETAKGLTRWGLLK